MYRIAAGLAVVALVALMKVPPMATDGLLHDRMLGVHLVLELFAVIIGVLVVAVSWHTMDARRSHAAHVVAGGFAIVVACDLLHALTYQGMPDFLSPASTPRAIFFWLMGRSVEVATLALLAWGRGNRLPRPLVAGGAALAIVVIAGIGSYRIEWFPTTFVEGVGVTPFKAGYEVVLCVLNLAVAAWLARRAAAGGGRVFRLLAMSSFMMGIGELAFTSYASPSDFQNIFGHLYKVVAYVLLYRATFLDSIRAPFEAVRESEARLRESELRLRTLADNLPQCVVYQLQMLPDGQRRFVHVSEAVARVNGVPVEAVLRDPSALYAQVHPEDMPTLVAAEERAQADMTVFDVRVRMRRADGAERRMHIVSAPRRQPDGSLLWDGVQMDVTEHEQAEASRWALEAHLREAQKMESIGTLASGIAHDFNNVLGSIIGNTTLAAEDAASGRRDKALESLEQVRRAAMRARELVRQILTFSRRQVTHRSVQALEPVVQEALGLLKATLPAGVRLETRFAATLPPVEVDATQLEQVVINLCTNAWQSMPAGHGHIEVALEPADVDTTTAAALGVAAGAYVALSVTDDGAGMDEATRLRIFEPFFTTKPTGTGTGLGLSVVHGIVRSHDGGIAVQSTPGVGSCFTIYLPSAKAPARVVADDAPLPAGRGRGERVLYLDDDELMLLMVERLLERAGYRVRTFGTPEAALAAFGSDPGGFDVVVTDFNMPTQSGLDVVRQVRAIAPGIATVLTSGSMTEELLAQARALGIDTVIEKQHTLETLAVAVDGALHAAREDAAQRAAQEAAAVR